MILIGAYAAGEMRRAVFAPDARSPGGRPQARAVPGVRLRVALLATFVNPYTYHLHAHIFEYLTATGYQYRNIVEFQSLIFINPVARILRADAAAGLAAVVWNLTRGDLPTALLIAGWAHLALVALRNTPIFMIVARVPVAMMLPAAGG